MSDAVEIVVRVTPRSSRDVIEGVDGEGAVRVRVTAAPTDGAANKAVIKLLAKALGVPNGALSVASGTTSRHKRLRLAGVSPAVVLELWPGASVRGR